MKIDYTITFKDALFLASHILERDRALARAEKYEADNPSYELTYELFEMAKTIYKESLRLAALNNSTPEP